MDILLIFIIQLIYVPILTLRTVFMVKNLKGKASVFATIEGLIYIFGVSLVLSGEQSIWAMIVYALGFGIGIYIGGVIENKLAIGYTSFFVNTQTKNEALIAKLRSDGYGVTIFRGEGRDGDRYKLEILTKRSLEEELKDIIDEFEPNAFVIAYEPREFRGGFLLKSMKKRRKKKIEKELNNKN